MPSLSGLYPAPFDPQVTGQIAIAIAVATAVSIVTIGLLFSGIAIFGPINDITNAVGGLLSALLAWQFHALPRERAPGTASLLLVVAWASSAAIIINSILVAMGRMHWMTGGMYMAFGFGLMGIWLFALLRLIGPQPFLTPGLVRMGVIAAIVMLFGLLAGPLLTTSGENLAKNPLAWIAYISVAGGWILYPLWCWLVGRQLIR